MRQVLGINVLLSSARRQISGEYLNGELCSRQNIEEGWIVKQAEYWNSGNSEEAEYSNKGNCEEGGILNRKNIETGGVLKQAEYWNGEKIEKNFNFSFEKVCCVSLLLFIFVLEKMPSMR